MTQENDDIAIETEEAAPAKMGDFVIWATGLPVVAPDPKKKGEFKSTNTNYVGFLLPVGKDEETDLDRACAAAGWEQKYIEHTNSTEAHWIPSEALALLLLTKAIPDFNAVSGDDNRVARGETLVRKGIAYGWQPTRDKDGDLIWKGPRTKNATFVVFKAIVPELAAQGYEQPLVFTFKSKMTQNVTEALQQHLENQKETLTIPEAKDALRAIRDELVGGGFDNVAGFPFFGSCITLGYVGDESFEGADGQKRKVGVVGLLQNGEDDDRQRWLQNQIATAYERSLCLNVIDETVAWSSDLTTRRIKLSEEELRKVAEQRLVTQGALPK